MTVFSNRALATPASPIRALAPLAREQEEKGKKVWYLNIGQPDVLAPDSFYKALHEFGPQMVKYAPSEGLKHLRESWSNLINTSVSTNISPEEMLITTGASEALLFAFASCCDTGEEVLTFDPTYANYIGISTIAGINLKSLLTDFNTGFALPPIEEIEKAITKKTKAILLCSPNNPTGSHYGSSTVEALSKLCKEKDIFFIVDESYREILFDGAKPFSVLNIDAESDHIIMIDSLSKRFSLCGARVGCIVSKNKKLIKCMWNMASTRLASPLIAQDACAKMIDATPKGFLKEVCDTYQARRDALIEATDKIDGVEIFKSSGAFYTIVDLPVDDAQSFAKFMLEDFDHEDETVFIAPAGGFYVSPDEALTKARIAFVLQPESLKRAMFVLGEALKNYNK